MAAPHLPWGKVFTGHDLHVVHTIPTERGCNIGSPGCNPLVTMGQRLLATPGFMPRLGVLRRILQLLHPLEISFVAPVEPGVVSVPPVAGCQKRLTPHITTDDVFCWAKYPGMNMTVFRFFLWFYATLVSPRLTVQEVRGVCSKEPFARDNGVVRRRQHGAFLSFPEHVALRATCSGKRMSYSTLPAAHRAMCPGRRLVGN
jgi:hypothetical protein